MCLNIIREKRGKKHEYGDVAKPKRRKILMQEEKNREKREKKLFQYNLVAPKQVIF
jgi:hypothetical protein